MANFFESFKKVLSAEGLYSDNVNDIGGITYCGISRVFFPDWNGWDYIDAVKNINGAPDFSLMPAEKKVALEIEVQNFYRNEFWKRIQGDRIPYQDVADELFDSAVNTGVGTAVEFLQDALNVLNRNGKSYADIDVDGRMGGNTLNALKYYENRAGERKALIKVMNLLQGNRYIEIARKTESQQVFLRGWLSRVSI